jgi:acyl carrier protein
MEKHYQAEQLQQIVFDKLNHMRLENEFIPQIIQAGDSLMADVGFDSISIIELLCHIEHATGINASVNTWIDRETDKETDRFTVTSLVEFLEEVQHVDQQPATEAGW